MLRLKKHGLFPRKRHADFGGYGIRRRTAAFPFKKNSAAGQALTEYILIVSVWFPFGLMVASLFAGMDEVEGYIIPLYTSMANFFALPFF